MGFNTVTWLVLFEVILLVVGHPTLDETLRKHFYGASSEEKVLQVKSEEDDGRSKRLVEEEAVVNGLDPDILKRYYADDKKTCGCKEMKTEAVTTTMKPKKKKRKTMCLSTTTEKPITNTCQCRTTMPVTTSCQCRTTTKKPRTSTTTTRHTTTTETPTSPTTTRKPSTTTTSQTPSTSTTSRSTTTTMKPSTSTTSAPITTTTSPSSTKTTTPCTSTTSTPASTTTTSLTTTSTTATTTTSSTPTSTTTTTPAITTTSTPSTTTTSTAASTTTTVTCTTTSTTAAPTTSTTTHKPFTPRPKRPHYHPIFKPAKPEHPRFPFHPMLPNHLKKEETDVSSESDDHSLPVPHRHRQQSIFLRPDCTDVETCSQHREAIRRILRRLNRLGPSDHRSDSELDHGPLKMDTVGLRIPRHRTVGVAPVVMSYDRPRDAREETNAPDCRRPEEDREYLRNLRRAMRDVKRSLRLRRNELPQCRDR